MRIVILGAGTVGTSVALTLYRHRHSVTMIERDPEVVRQLRDTVDALVIEGSVTHAATLFKADVMNADLCLALTNSDETNILAASMAKAMGTRRALARVFSPVIHNSSTFDYRGFFKIDRLLSLEQLSALRLAREIDQYTGMLTFDSLARGEIVLVEFAIPPKAKSIGQKIRELNFPAGVRIGTIRREGKNVIASAEDILRAGDFLAVIGDQEKITQVRKILDAKSPEPRNIIIAGGGETGVHLALLLQKTHHIRLMDADFARCQTLCAMLDARVEVLHADVLKRSVLEEYGQDADIFVACMGNDENNLLACVEAKALGAKKVLSIISRPDYGNVIKKLEIDDYVSPREEAAQQVLGFLNLGAVIFDDGLLGSGIRLLEVEVQPNSPISRVPLKDAQLPAQCVVLAATYSGGICVPGASHHFSPGDTAIMVARAQDKEEILRKFET